MLNLALNAREEKIASVVSLLRDAKDEGDEGEILRLLLLLFSLRVSGRYMAQIRRVFRAASAQFRLREESGTLTPRAAVQIFAATEVAVQVNFREAVDRLSRELIDEYWSALGSGSPEKRAALTGGGTDKDGEYLPQPGERPGNIPPTLSFEEAILWASPLLFLAGNTPLRRSTSELGQRVGVEAVSQNPRGGLNPYRGTVARIFQSRRLPAFSASVLQSVRDGDLRSASSAFDTRLGSLERATERRLVSEVNSVFGNVGSSIAGGTPGIRGWTLRSRFLPTTAPDHFTNSGLTFLKDGTGSLPYSESDQYFPPYGHPNCVCYPEYIYGGEEDGPRESLGLPGAPEVGARSLFTWDEYFTAQSREAKESLVGADRLAASSGSSWFSLSDRKGRLLSASQLNSETLQSAGERAADIRARAESEYQRNLVAWATGLWLLTLSEESEARRILDSYL